jgi:hypothetical protein
VVATTNSPFGYVTLLGLHQGLSMTAQNTDKVEGHEWLQQLSEGGHPTQSVASAAVKVKSYGRTVLGRGYF